VHRQEGLAPGPDARRGPSRCLRPHPRVPGLPWALAAKTARAGQHTLEPVVAPQPPPARPVGRSQAGAVRVRPPTLVNGNAQTELPRLQPKHD
jgi:hypothetical protein